MIFEPNLVDINRLFRMNNLNINIADFQVMSGTTDGLIVKLTSEQRRMVNQTY